MIKQYNKLVRDNIPNIIARDGKLAHTVTLSQEDYLDALDLKLTEEVSEYIADGSEIEIADILEVVEAIIVARGYDRNEIEAIKAEKKRTHGAFEQRVFLTQVTE